MKINWEGIRNGMLFFLWHLSAIAIVFGGLGFVLAKLENALL